MSLKEDLKKDKKKVFFIVVAIIAIILAIVFSVLKASGEEEQDTTAMNDLETVVVPIDESKIESSKYDSGKSSVSNGDFFGSSGVTNQDTAQEVNAFIDPVENKQKTSSYKSSGVVQGPTSTKSSNSNNYSATTTNNKVESQPKEVVHQETTPELKRRTPNDKLGNATVKSKQMYSAVIDNSNNIVRSGAYVNLRLAEDVNIDGVFLPRNSLITGRAQYAQLRMNIVVNSVKVGNQFRQVDWHVFDEDGNLGLPLPESLINDIVSDGANEAVEAGGSSVEGNVPVVGNVKVNVKKKNKEVSYVLNTGHRVYLKKGN